LKPKTIVSASASDNAAAVEFSEADYARECRRAQAFFPRGPLLSESLERLSQRLHSAFTDTAASERERYIQAINAVGYFLIDFNGGDGYAFKFLELQLALEDLDKGTTAPFLKKKAGRGRRHDPEEIWEARAVVTIGIEALLQADEDREEILKHINRHHRGLHSLMTLESDKTDLTSDKTNPLQSRAISFESSVWGWHYKFTSRKSPTKKSGVVFAQLQYDLAKRCHNRKSDPEAKRRLLHDTANLAFTRAAKIGLDFKRRKELAESDNQSEE
jgi:hypothetical protein